MREAHGFFIDRRNSNSGLSPAAHRRAKRLYSFSKRHLVIRYARPGTACATKCIVLFREGDDEACDGDCGGADRDPEGGGEGAVAVGGGVALGLVVGFDVYNVVLLHVING